MRKYRIDILCLQETRAPKAEYYTDNGFFIILSGSEEVKRSFAGVGFVVAPWCKHRVCGFLQFSDRMASLRVRGGEGQVAFICAYAPHNLKPYDERHRFYSDLGHLSDRTAVNGPKYFVGDFNARIGRRRPGEEDIMGPFTFGREAVHQVDTPNRDLLVEFCTDRDCVVANTIEQGIPEQKVTFVEAGVAPMSTPTVDRFAMLDLLLAPAAHLSTVVTVSSIREATLASDHFLVYFKLDCSHAAPTTKSQVRKKNLVSLRSPSVRQDFVRTFAQSNQFEELDTGNLVEMWWSQIDASFTTAAEKIPDAAIVPRRPWISEETVQLISDRAAARAGGDHALEKLLHKAVRRSAKIDKGRWLDDSVANGSWRNVRNLRKPPAARQGRLKDRAGELVSSEERAETMAAYLEKVQWCVRPAEVLDQPVLGQTLPVPLTNFSDQEVRACLRKLHNGKAPGPDGTPAEYWKVLGDSSEVVQQVTEFVNICWNLRRIPDAWHLAQVTAVHKKGRTDECENYRPISLLNIGYKIFAALLHSRIVQGGAERRLTNTQFGFRSGYGTQDAIFILRRQIELAWARRDGRLTVLALDWQRAFDSVDPSALVAGLRRFGLPEHVLEVIRAIYTNRYFEVRDCGVASSRRPQRAGISQGCPLSPLLFVMVMTVVLEDAVARLGEADQLLIQRHTLAALLYADDTLLLGWGAASVQRFLVAVQSAGATFGLQLHEKKFQLIGVNAAGCLRDSAGNDIEMQSEMVYLGALITDDGRIHRELARRIGAANADFRALSRVWRHSSLNRDRKLRIFNATIVSKLTYGLATAVLGVAEKRRLNGFHNRCLRSIWGIKPSFISRVSNQSVLETTNQKPLTHHLARQQLLLYGKAARALDGGLMRESTFSPKTLLPATDRFVRKRGRPRLEWVSEVSKLAGRLTRDYSELKQAIATETNWKALVDGYCNNNIIV